MISFLLIPWCSQGIFLPFLRLHSTFRNPLGWSSTTISSFIFFCKVVFPCWFGVPKSTYGKLIAFLLTLFSGLYLICMGYRPVPVFLLPIMAISLPLYITKLSLSVFDSIFLFHNNYNEKGMRISLFIFFITIYSKYKSI